MRIRKKVGDTLRWVSSRFTNRSAILLYHRVVDDPLDPFNLCVSPENFDQQMATIRDIGTPLSLPDFVKQREEGTLPSNAICVTFDDAYVDVLENALPVLSKYEIPATVYAISGSIGEVFWWDRVIDHIYKSGTLPKSLTLQVGKSRVSLTVAKMPRHLILKSLYPHLQKMDPSERLIQIDSLATQLSSQAHANTGRRSMTEEELRLLAQHPLVTVGAHTVSHSRLAALSLDAQAHEIRTSKAQLESIIGEPVTSFSYPFGLRSRDYTSDTMTAAKQAGLNHAVAADLSAVTSSSDPFSLPRLWMHNLDGPQTIKRIKRWL